MSNEINAPQSDQDKPLSLHEIVNRKIIDNLVDQFGVPEDGTTAFADERARLVAEDDLESRAKGEPKLSMPALDGSLNIPEQAVDIRDGFDVQRVEGLQDNDPITQAIIDTHNGDNATLDALDPESQSAAKMMMSAAEDIGKNPGDLAADITSPLHDQPLPPTNPNVEG